jgi:hypothetical protein
MQYKPIKNCHVENAGHGRILTLVQLAHFSCFHPNSKHTLKMQIKIFQSML